MRFRGTTRLAFLHALQAFKALKEFLLLYLIVAKVERPLSGYCAAWEPPTRSYLLLVERSSYVTRAFFGQPLTKGF